jgi:primase-polymerase (primpol)-like protein
MKIENELLKVLIPYPQWVTHDEKKRPFQPGNGHFARVNDSSTWTDYEAVENCKRKGFVLTDEDPFTVIDLDHCIGSHGRVQPQINKILLYFQSYTEISPSGTGFHVWIRGKIPSAIKRTEFEIYSTLRYVTVTENVTLLSVRKICVIFTVLVSSFVKYGTLNVILRNRTAVPIGPLMIWR